MTQATINSTDSLIQTFGFLKPPFGLVAEQELFRSGSHVGALEFMAEILWTRRRIGFVVGAAGCGKTVLARHFVSQLDERVIAGAILDPPLGPREFQTEILRQFGISLSDSDKADRGRLLENFLQHQLTMGRLCVLLIENAHQMHPAVLEELRALAAIRADDLQALKLIFLGPPAVHRVLTSPRMRMVIDEAIPSYALHALDEDETAAYIAQRLSIAGVANPEALIPAMLVGPIHVHSNGVPSTIDRLCTQLLLSTQAAGMDMATPEAFEQTIVQMGESMPMAPVIPLDTGDSPRGRLIVSTQGDANVEIPLGEPSSRILIGRSELADIHIDSVYVSRCHALIVRDRNKDLLIDLGSTNGVLVNSHRVTRKTLEHGDLIQIGPARVSYLNAEAVAPAADLDQTVSFARPGFTAEGDASHTGAVVGFGRDGNYG
jgi:type II secretory pathway predicted ATPase ExeA